MIFKLLVQDLSLICLPSRLIGTFCRSYAPWQGPTRLRATCESRRRGSGERTRLGVPLLKNTCIATPRHISFLKQKPSSAILSTSVFQRVRTMASPREDRFFQMSFYWEAELRRILGVHRENDLPSVFDDVGLEMSTQNTMLDEIKRHVYKTLPTLALHFDGKALEALRKAHPWLQLFERGQIDGWEEAKSAFFENGPAFLDALAKFTELTRNENLLAALLSWDLTFSTRLLQTMRAELDHHFEEEENDWEERHQSELLRSKELANELLDAGEAGSVTWSRIEALLSVHSKVEGGPLALNRLMRVRDRVPGTSGINQLTGSA